MHFSFICDKIEVINNKLKYMKFYKRKFFWIVVVIILVIGSLVYSKIKNSNAGPDYEMVKVERGNLFQTVDAVGKVESADHLELHFELSGTLEYIAIKEGDEVKAGQLLANLKLHELNSAVAQAQANLNQKLAGSTDEDIRYYEAAAQVAKVNWEKSKVDSDTNIASAQSAVETSKNNLKLAEGGEASQIVSSVYEDSVSLLHTVNSVLSNGLTQADNILGIDNSLANDSFENYLSSLNSSKLNEANTYYNQAKAKKNEASEKINNLTTFSQHADIDEAINYEEVALSKMNQLLSSVYEVLVYTPPVGDLSQTSLDAKKTILETTRSAVSSKYTSTINQRQAIVDAKNSYITYQIAYNKSIQDLEGVKLTAQNYIDIQKATYDQALANLDKIKIGPREVDVAYYRAALSQSIANRNKAIILAPIDGVVTKINKEKGELIMSSEIMIETLSPHYEIEVDIPETDIIKLAIGDQVEITLDAFGDDEEFLGSVVSIEPASTEIQDVVYYKVKVALEEGVFNVRSGMTANVLISTEEKEDVLYLPFRAVLSHNGSESRYVRVLEGGELKEMSVKVGLRGDDGVLEVLEGVEEGQEVILKIIE